MGDYIAPKLPKVPITIDKDTKEFLERLLLILEEVLRALERRL
jgi:hypothetical protein